MPPLIVPLNGKNQILKYLLAFRKELWTTFVLFNAIGYEQNNLAAKLEGLYVDS